jgi:hypothetical protein
VNETVVVVVVLAALSCAALIAIGCLGAVLFVSGRETDQERDRGIEG